MPRADTATRALLTGYRVHPVLRQVVTAERMFLATLGAGCSFPAAAHAEQFGTTLKLNALVANNGRVVRAKMAGHTDTAAGLGRALAQQLITAAGLDVGNSAKP